MAFLATKGSGDFQYHSMPFECQADTHCLEKASSLLMRTHKQWLTINAAWHASLRNEGMSLIVLLSWFLYADDDSVQHIGFEKHTCIIDRSIPGVKLRTLMDVFISQQRICKHCPLFALLFEWISSGQRCSVSAYRTTCRGWHCLFLLFRLYLHLRPAVLRSLDRYRGTQKRTRFITKWQGPPMYFKNLWCTLQEYQPCTIATMACSFLTEIQGWCKPTDSVKFCRSASHTCSHI